jgi:biotin-dependent carboxylase-like uncharacterized protein
VSAALEVRSPGACACIQDAGRFGYRRIGVPWSGALAPDLLAIANRLVGNVDTAPAIECFGGGQVFAALDAPLRVALAGVADAEIECDGELRRVAPWRSLHIAPGELLRIRAVRDGRIAMLAVAGIEVPQVLGSASTHARSGLGGGWLAAGQRIAARAATGGPDHVLDAPPATTDAPFRVVAGPQADHFTAETLERFVQAEYHIGTAADRMGMRLEGPALTHCSGAAREIVSDAIVPGAIQVPGHGQPIVLLADAQTAGGYPKIACVISADLARLATRAPGASVRFKLIDAASGESAAREAAKRLATLLASIRPLAADGPDVDALYSLNLVGGVVDALAPLPETDSE